MSNKSSISCPFQKKSTKIIDACEGCLMKDEMFLQDLEIFELYAYAIGKSPDYPSHIESSEYGQILSVAQYCPIVEGDYHFIRINLFLEDEFDMNLKWIDRVTKDQAFEQITFPDGYVSIKRFPKVEAIPEGDRRYFERIIGDSNVFYPYSIPERKVMAS